MASEIPRLQLVELRTADGEAALRVPQMILSTGLFAADEELVRLTRGGDRSLLCFGSTGLQGKICLDEGSGQVIDLWSSDSEPRAIDLVNTSLEAFIRCARVVVERYPYYADDADDDVPMDFGAEIQRVLAGIDGATQLVDSYWMTFIDDVQMGSFSTQEV
jgi:hypothetical protein